MLLGASIASVLLAGVLALAIGWSTRTLLSSLQGLLAGLLLGLLLAMLLTGSIQAHKQADYQQRTREFVAYAQVLLAGPSDEARRRFGALRSVSAPELLCRLGRRKADWRYIGMPGADDLPDPPVSSARLLQVGAFVADSGKSREEKRIALALLLEALRQRDASDDLREWAALWQRALPDALQDVPMPRSDYPHQRQQFRKYHVNGCGYGDPRIYQGDSLCLALGLGAHSSVDTGSEAWLAALHGLQSEHCPGSGANDPASPMR